MWTEQQKALDEKKTKEMLRGYGITAEMTDDDFKDPVSRKKKLLKMHRQAERGPADAYLEKIGQHIREKRKAAGLSQAQLVEKAMIDLPAISRLENGRRNASITTLKNLAEAMGCELRIEFVRKYKKEDSPVPLQPTLD